MSKPKNPPVARNEDYPPDDILREFLATQKKELGLKAQRLRQPKTTSRKINRCAA